MATPTNAQIVRRMFEELGKGNAQAWLDGLAEDVVFTIAGTTKFSGTMRGKKEVVDRLLAPLGAALDGGIALDIERVLADGDHVVMLSKGRARTKEGRPYANTYAHVFRLAGGKVREVREFMDTELVTATFGR